MQFFFFFPKKKIRNTEDIGLISKNVEIKIREVKSED